MENQANSSSQSRFLIAAVLSMVILFGWSYLFTPTRPPAENSNAATSNANTSVPTPVATAAQPTPEIAQAPLPPPPDMPRRELTVRSPLFEVKLDSKGGLATSWVIHKNVSPKSEFAVYADRSTEADKKPLQLISQRALEQTPRDIPFRLSTGDPALDLVLNDSAYSVEGSDTDDVALTGDDSRSIEFVHRQDIMLAGATSPVEVRKKFTFSANSYVTDLAVTITRGGQPVPNVKLLIGASIGDHAINYHDLYHPESEAVAAIDGDIARHWGYYSFNFQPDARAAISQKGSVDWAGVGDNYFAMVAVPARPSDGIEYTASKYETPIEPVFDSIISWVTRSPKTSEVRHSVTTHLPIAADGSTTKVFTGTKDYFLLTQQSEVLSQQLGRPISIVDTINFSNYWWLRWLTKPLSIPILYALHFLNSVFQSYGLAIIVFTFLFYSLLFPLRWSQSKSFKKASGNAPKMKEIQDKIKEMQKKGVPTDDPRMRALQMEQLKLTKDALPIGGCLPMLLQFPLLLAFFTAVTIAPEIRQASFLWLPDLSAGDPWHILEFAFAASMILAMKLTPTAATVTPEQQMQQKMMTYVMPAMMLWIMWLAPSGLLLYWFFGNVVSFGQQMLINRLNKPNTPPGTEIVDTVPKGAKKVNPKLKTA